MPLTREARKALEADWYRQAAAELPLAELGVPDSWDLLLIGDGSGSNWTRGCGWAVHLLTRTGRLYERLIGGLSHGSVNVAELMAYLHALAWYDGRHGNPVTTPTVHILTDSEVTANCGNNAHMRGSNMALWAAFGYFEARYDVTFHWIARQSCRLNDIADKYSRLARLVVEEIYKEPVIACESTSPSS